MTKRPFVPPLKPADNQNTPSLQSLELGIIKPPPKPIINVSETTGSKVISSTETFGDRNAIFINKEKLQNDKEPINYPNGIQRTKSETTNVIIDSQTQVQTKIVEKIVYVDREIREVIVIEPDEEKKKRPLDNEM